MEKVEMASIKVFESHQGPSIQVEIFDKEVYNRECLCTNDAVIRGEEPLKMSIEELCTHFYDYACRISTMMLMEEE